ncbi:MAG: DUF5067 domain-containing protein [Oscillospiraceae bacterium]|nr:DUF5067 domain-containing protein [Oscillospiraceae bacterium]MBR6595193.1 DUF5067 domain-containing protein [Oscillospiraceae bacterium]
MKKTYLFLISIILIFSLSACALFPMPFGNPFVNSGDNSDSADPNQSIKIPEATVPAAVIEPEGELGDFYVKITSFELIEDYNGDPSILIVYSFTNNSQESAAAIYEVSTRAYQNGVELSDALTYSLDNYDSGISMKEIQPGITIDIPCVYLLSSETAPVEFEIGELFSLDPNIVGDVFEISESGETVLSRAPEGVMDFKVGAFDVSVVSYRVSKDYDGSSVLILELGVTNNGPNSESFDLSAEINAFQNGIELSTAYMVDGVDSHTKRALLRPGAGVAVYYCFTLSDESPVDFELSELISFDDTVHTFTVELDQ